jgi:TPR repeat protein
MKPILLYLFVALLMGGCGQESQSANSNESEFERIERQAEGGDKVAQNNLGYMYENGIGVTEDNLEAAKWFTKAAEQGHAGAYNNLGRSKRGQTLNLNISLSFASVIRMSECHASSVLSILGRFIM